jgi:aldehyde dehydrogenase (NAD+)
MERQLSVVRMESSRECALQLQDQKSTYRCIPTQPALAAGNTFLYKPSEKAPLGTLALGTLIKECFPPGVINIINGGGKTGQLMAAHMEIRQIAFTGSTATGRKIQE